MTEQTNTAFDSMDPHGFHAHDAHEGHHVVSLRMLVGVLTVLLAFTVLTVAASRAEVWFGEAMGIVIPQWVNVAVAMSIAVVKGTLVLMFFMQLYYDKPLNTIIFSSCLFAFALFLGLTALDLGSRGSIYSWKSGEIIAGGNSVGLVRSVDGIAMSQNVPIQVWAKEVEINELGSVEAFEIEAAHHRGHVDTASTADVSRPRAGATPGLFDATEPGSHEDDAEHGDEAEQGEEEHADDTSDH